jgi:serpin B
VVHQAFISVDEQGTEAAAATAVVMAESSGGGLPTTITIDRPFLFLIRHDPTGEILFMGQVTDPS